MKTWHKSHSQQVAHIMLLYAQACKSPLGRLRFLPVVIMTSVLATASIRALWRKQAYCILNTQLCWLLSLQPQAEPFVYKAGHQEKLFYYFIGFDFSFIIWSEITMAYLEDLLKRLEETSYFLTACFLNGLNGFSSVVNNQRFREIKCVAAGDPYCELEII